MRIVALALAFSAPFAVAQEEKPDPGVRIAELEKRAAEAAARMKELESLLRASDAARAALEKRLGESEKSQGEIQLRLRDFEGARDALEKRLAVVEKASPGIQSRVKDLEVARSEQEAARVALERRIAEADRARAELLKPIRDLESGRDALARRLTEVDREIRGARTALETKVTEAERARQDQALVLERRVVEVDRRREELLPPLRDLQAARERLERETGLLSGRVQAQELDLHEGRERAVRLRAEVRETRLALLRTAVPAGDGGFLYPNEDHFPILGVVFGYLKKDASQRHGLAEGEGIALRRIDLGTPAHESDLHHGDVVTRVDGVPVRNSGIRTTRNLAGPWEDHTELPNFLAERLPGETVRLEYVRGGETRQLEIELRCRKCAGACPFFTPPLPR